MCTVFVISCIPLCIMCNCKAFCLQGHWSDMLGRRASLLVCLLLSAGGYGLLAASSTIFLMFAARVITGESLRPHTISIIIQLVMLSAVINHKQCISCSSILISMLIVSTDYFRRIRWFSICSNMIMIAVDR